MSTLEKTLPQLLAKLSLLENRGAHNASLALSASIGRVRELIAQARGAASKVGTSAREGGGIWETEWWMLMVRAPFPQVKVSMKFNGHSGVQLRAPRDLTDLAAYTALKFYLQSPEPASDQVPEDQFVLYMGNRQVLGLARWAGWRRASGWSGQAMPGPCPTESRTTTGHWRLHGCSSA